MPVASCTPKIMLPIKFAFRRHSQLSGFKNRYTDGGDRCLQSCEYLLNANFIGSITFGVHDATGIPVTSDS